MVRFLLLFCGLLPACLQGAAEEPSSDPAPVWNSIPDKWHGGTVARREWNDRSGQPQLMELVRRKDNGTRFYVLHAVSSVCGDAGKKSSCTIHRFTACFDEMGRFIGYRVGKDHPFTRAKHEPFVPKDYKTLDRILRDPIHVLSTIAGQTGGVDAVSGATLRHVAEQSVPGAFYTSKAVWDIAQDTGPAKAKAWTLARSTAEDVRSWRVNGEMLKLWWFLDHAEKSTLLEKTQRDLAYELLAFQQADVQAAAIRYLDRTTAPFDAARSQSDGYVQLDEVVKPNFLAWWRRHRHAPRPLIDALVKELHDRADRRSLVAAHALDFLSAMGTIREERCRSVLKELAQKNPSTYIRRLAKRLLASER